MDKIKSSRGGCSCGLPHTAGTGRVSFIDLHSAAPFPQVRSKGNPLNIEEQDNIC